MRRQDRLFWQIFAAPDNETRMGASPHSMGSPTMETIWDWMTVFAFAGLVTLMLQRSSEKVPRDRLIEYLPAAGGCAVVNYLGNEGMVLGAVLLSVATLAYVFMVLKPNLPFGPNSK
jgi:hypothetical protein